LRIIVVIHEVVLFLQCVKYDKAIGFPTEDEAVHEGMYLLSSEKLWAVVVFTNIDNSSTTIPNHLVYKIRYFKAYVYVDTKLGNRS